MVPAGAAVGTAAGVVAGVVDGEAVSAGLARSVMVTPRVSSLALRVLPRPPVAFGADSPVAFGAEPGAGVGVGAVSVVGRRSVADAAAVLSVDEAVAVRDAGTASVVAATPFLAFTRPETAEPKPPKTSLSMYRIGVPTIFEPDSFVTPASPSLAPPFTRALAKPMSKAPNPTFTPAWPSCFNPSPTFPSPNALVASCRSLAPGRMKRSPGIPAPKMSPYRGIFVSAAQLAKADGV